MNIISLSKIIERGNCMEEFEKDEMFRYLKHFDKIFSTKLENNLNIDKLILFFTGFKRMIDEIDLQTDDYLDIQKEKLDLIEKFNFNEEQMKCFHKYCELESKTAEIYRKEIMLFEYIFMEFF